MATNSGKTYVAASIIASTGFKAIVIVPSVALLHQTSSDLEKLLQVKIGKYGDGHKSYEDVTVATIMSAKKLTALPEIKDNIAVIADECHRMKSDSMYSAFHNLPGIVRIGMSGTPLHYSALEDMKLYGSTGQILYHVTNEYLENKGYSSKASIIMHKIESLSET